MADHSLINKAKLVRKALNQIEELERFLSDSKKYCTGEIVGTSAGGDIENHYTVPVEQLVKFAENELRVWRGVLGGELGG